jgi:hypothetical protein
MKVLDEMLDIAGRSSAPIVSIQIYVRLFQRTVLQYHYGEFLSYKTHVMEDEDLEDLCLVKKIFNELATKSSDG